MAEIPTDRHVSYQRSYRKCGKATCTTCRNGGQGHGPYIYAYYHEQGELRKDGKGYKNGKLKSKYVGKGHPDLQELREAIEKQS